MSKNTTDFKSLFLKDMEQHFKRYYDMQEKCSFMNTIFENGRRKCDEAKLNFHMGITEDFANAIILFTDDTMTQLPNK